MATESSLEIMKRDFYFTVKDFFVLGVFRFLLGLFALDKKARLNFKIFGVTKWIKIYRNTHIAWCFRK